ncbi:MAG: leucine-rich repeat protein, partial [Clostridia bacterium]|nr:leucine-rich repeat protein [Clostridia bacterium]
MMRSTLKKTLALILCLVMCLALFPAAAFAEETVTFDLEDPFINKQEAEASILEIDAAAGDPSEIIDSGTCGQESGVIIWTLYDSGKLVIAYQSGYREMENYASQEAPWYSYRNDITSVSIGEGVSTVGQNAFYDCSKIQNVELPSSLVIIRTNAFRGCSALTSISLPVSLTGISSSAFYGCTALTDVYYGGTESQKNARVSSGGWVTGGNNPLFNATWHYFESEEPVVIASGTCGMQWSYINWTLYDDGALIITNQSGHGEMQNYGGTNNAPWAMYKNNIATVSIGEGVCTVGAYAFSNCKNITNVELPNSLVAIRNDAFRGCCALTSIVIPTAVYSIGIDAFQDCSSLESIILSDSLEYLADNVFKNCSSLDSLTIPMSVTSVGSAVFSGCGALTSITIPESVTSIGDNAFSDCISLETAEIGSGVTSIGSAAFSGCSALTSITIPDSVTNIGNSAFSGCSALTSATLSNNITSIGEQFFYNCSSLVSTTIPANLTSIGHAAFSGCSALTSITIPESVKNIGDSAFYGCRAFAEITIPNSVTSIGSKAFYGCDGLSSVMIPASVTKIGDAAFSGCREMAAIHVTDGNTSYCSVDGVLFTADMSTLVSFPGGWQGAYTVPDGVTRIAYSACGRCSGLTFVTVPDSVAALGSSLLTALGEVFLDCSGLTSAVIGSGVKTINGETFRNCSALASVTITNCVKDIGGYAFNGCNSLTDVYYGGTRAQWNAVSIDGGNEPLYYATIHCTDDEPSFYTVSYDANGGTGAPEAQTKTSGEDLILSSTVPARADSSAGSYAVVFNANGGSVNPSSAEAERTTRYSFQSWNTAVNGSGSSYAPGGVYTTDEAVTLYAQWQNTTITAAITLPTPSRDGYVFMGWATSSTAAMGMTGSYTPEGNIILYAVWEESQTCTHPENQIVTDPAVPATCAHTGLTEGSHCGACGEVIVAQTVVPKLPHTPGEPVGAVEPTETEDGYSGDIYCTVCNTLLEQGHVIYAHNKEENDIVWEADTILSAMTIVGGTEEDPVVITVNGTVMLTGTVTISSGYVEIVSGSGQRGMLIARGQSFASNDGLLSFGGTGLSIYGVDLKNETSGLNLAGVRGLNDRGNSLTLEDVEIRDFPWCAVYSNRMTATIDNCVVDNCDYGLNYLSSSSVVRNTVIRNCSDYGIHSTMTVIGCTITGNEIGICYGGSITDSTVQGNTTDVEGSTLTLNGAVTIGLVDM